MDVDGNNVGDSPCDKVSEGVVQFQCIYTGPVSNIQIIIKGERYRFYFRFVASIPSGNPEGFTSIISK